MFMGEYQHAVDAKGRMIIPARFRELLGERFVLTRGLDGALFGYSLEEWARQEERLKALPVSKKDARAFTRFFFSGAAELELDKQGRAHIPANLRAHAALQKECMIIGVSSRFEIWAKSAWDAYCEDSAESFNELAESLQDFGF